MTEQEKANPDFEKDKKALIDVLTKFKGTNYKALAKTSTVNKRTE